MIAPPTKPPVWVARKTDLKTMAADLEQHTILAVDTESNSLHAYQEQVCLIQFSTGETDYLVDPLALPELEVLGPIFSNPNIEKVFHAAEYDIICLKRDFDFSFSNLFDTMIAGRILGRSAVGLGSMMEETFGITLDKHYQRANWGQRPLSSSQLSYARLDTHYLVDLRNLLKKDLEESRRWPIAEEDFRRECNIVPPPTNGNGDSVWRVAGNNDLSPAQAAVLSELIHYRAGLAQAHDVPPFKVLGNQVLVDIAQACPTDPNRLAECADLNPRQFDRHCRGLLDAVQRGLQAPALHRPYRPRPDERFIKRLDRLRAWRKQAGEEMGVESDVILPKDVLESIAENNPTNRDELNRLMADLPWRLEKFGSQILKTVAK